MLRKLKFLLFMVGILILRGGACAGDVCDIEESFFVSESDLEPCLMIDELRDDFIVDLPGRYHRNREIYLEQDNYILNVTRQCDIGIVLCDDIPYYCVYCLQIWDLGWTRCTHMGYGRCVKAYKKNVTPGSYRITVSVHECSPPSTYDIWIVGR